MKFFDQFPVTAFISDASVDFTPLDFDAPLSQGQRAYLKKETGRDISQVFWRKQVHEDGIITARASASACHGCPDADAFITDHINLPIAIRTADCVPVFIYDPVKSVIGLVHAGWKGSYAQITAKTIKKMQRDFGSQGKDLKAAIGPSIRSCCYQVTEEFKTYFPKDMSMRAGQLYVDVVNANRRQIMSVGVSEANIIDSGVCTMCSRVNGKFEYFSFRRDADKAGRMISVMML